MKFRTDFVTNSSSASYILDVALIGDNGVGASLNLAVSPETCMCEDGAMTAEDITLYPLQLDGKPSFGGHTVKSATSIDELIDWIAEDATIDQFYPRTGFGWDDLEEKTVYVDPELKLVSYKNIDEIKEYVNDNGGNIVDNPEEAEIVVSDKDKTIYPDMYNELEFMARYDSDRFDDEKEDLLNDISVAEVCPQSVATFKKSCKKAGLTMDNLKRIDINNAKWGSGDSAMWVEKDILEDYKDRYLSAGSDEEKASITEEAVEFMLSKPVVEVNDNEGCLDDEMQIVLEDNDEAVIREEVMKYFRGEGRSYWMGQNSSIYRIDAKADTIEREYVLVLEAD